MKITPLSEMEAIDEATGTLNIIVETPRGSRNKYTYLAGLDLFELAKALPAGCSFPYDFGLVPSTIGEDGDPLDVLVLMEAPVYPAVLVRARLIGAMEARQTGKDETVRNNRLIAVAGNSKMYSGVKELKDLHEAALREMEHFFVSYNEVAGKTFKVTGHADAKDARKLVDAGRRRLEEKMERENRNG